MGFDTQKFETTNFRDRVESVPVPRLAQFFGKDEEPVWKIRGLTGLESAIAKQEVTENQMQKIKKIVEALGSKAPSAVAEVAKLLVNVKTEDPDPPNELILRYGWLEYGSVDPVCSHEMAMKLAHNFYEDFLVLTNKIGELSGDGRLGE